MKQGNSLPRTSNVGTLQERISSAEARHRELEARLKQIERHPFLTPAEQIEATALKKQKLQAKDEIDTLRRSTAKV